MAFEGAAKKFPIVGIGASAGGLAAIEAFLSAMPADTEPGFAFVIIQHLPPDHKSILSELVKRYTRMQVFEAEDGMEVMPNCAYIIPPNRDLALLGDKLQLLEQGMSRGIRHPIDFFFRSLAADQHDKAICVVLSGTGSDGTLGVRAVKGEGGMAMAQTPESTAFDGMPRSAIATGLVDYILPPAEMPKQLIAYVNQLVGKHAPRSETPSQTSDSLAKICVILRVQTGHDFSGYKHGTITRRVERRMVLHQIEKLSDYVRFLQPSAAEVSALFRDLLIGVTSFFRDVEAFAALERIVIPRMFAGVPEGGPVRIWVCGCSTGEEAFSIAMLLEEFLERVGKVFKVQIFATDIDRQAIEQARSGVFAPNIATDISAARLARFFKQDAAGSYRIQKAVRDLLIFSEHDVLKDPPFSRLSLVSCRNLLIYLNADVQKRLMSLFHYALRLDGMLFLGTSETVGDQPHLFETVDRKGKLYLRKGEAGGLLAEQTAEKMPASEVVHTANTALGEPPKEGLPSLRQITEQALLRQLTKAAILVDGRGEILYFHGRTGSYLEPAPGNVAANVLTMAREGLRRDLTGALHRAAAQNEVVHVYGLRVKTNGHWITADLTVQPAAATTTTDLFVVLLEEKPAEEVAESAAAKSDGSDAQSQARIAALEKEVRAKDEYIHTIQEEMDTSSEELKSSNEELQSVNEELQSTNEELETSKEELQSVNEELAVVNAELQEKVAGLSRANDDLSNLLAGTGVATLFVDHNLNIARFTPTITQIINLIDSDVGRPLAHIVSNLVAYDHLLDDVRAVLDSLIPLEVEAQSKSANWYILGIRPYRTRENMIEGAVITFVDITQRKLAEKKALEAERFRRAADIETVGIVFYQIGGEITSANNAFLKMVGYSREDLTDGKILWDSITPEMGMLRARQGMDEIRELGRTAPYEREYVKKDGSSGWALFAAWKITPAEAVVYVIEVAKGSAAGAAE
jgi:two-component system CheB/CheR fusion protein